MSYKVPLSSVIVLLKTLNSSFSTYWFVWCLNRWDVVAAGRTAPDSRVSSVAPFKKTKPSSPSLKFVGSRASSGAASQPAGTTHKPPCGPSPFEGAFHCGSCCLASSVSGLQADGSRQESLLPLGILPRTRSEPQCHSSDLRSAQLAALPLQLYTTPLLRESVGEDHIQLWFRNSLFLQELLLGVWWVLWNRRWVLTEWFFFL